MNLIKYLKNLFNKNTSSEKLYYLDGIKVIKPNKKALDECTITIKEVP